jgi:hypothetical protein
MVGVESSLHMSPVLPAAIHWQHPQWQRFTGSIHPGSGLPAAGLSFILEIWYPFL